MRITFSKNKKTFLTDKDSWSVKKDGETVAQIQSIHNTCFYWYRLDHVLYNSLAHKITFRSLDDVKIEIKNLYKKEENNKGFLNGL